MMKMSNPLVSVCLIASLVVGCSSQPVRKKSTDIDKIYNRIYRDGARDTVAMLRHGLGYRRSYGVTDPAYPLRIPEVIVPIYVVPRVDKRTGRRIAGHWEHAVLRPSRWQTD